MKKLINILIAISSFIFILTFSIYITCHTKSFYKFQFENIYIKDIKPHQDNLISILEYGIKNISKESLTNKEKKEKKKHLENKIILIKTKFNKENSLKAYYDMQDYILFKKNNFKPNLLNFTEAGADHFKDVRTLILVNDIFFIISLIGLIILYYLKLYIKKLRGFKKINPELIGVIILVSSFLLIFGLASINFSKAFDIFHRLFFPGKENFIFNPTQDEIINILPERYFMNCAILIFSIIIGVCLFLIVYSIYKILKNKRQKNKV